jgi:hypothetical protein
LGVLTATLLSLTSNVSMKANAAVRLPTVAEQRCGASDVRRVVVRFIAASNSRDTTKLDALVARDDLFRWFTIEDRERRRHVGIYRRGLLVRYLARHRRGETFRLVSFRFNGSGGYGHFEYRLAVTRPSVRVLYDGKGAVTCTAPHRVAVWSMGNV